MNQQIKKIKGITVEDIENIFEKENILRIREPEGRPWIYIYFKESYAIGEDEIEELNKKGFKINFISFKLNAITIDSIRGF